MDLKNYLKSFGRRAILENKYRKSPEIRALIHRRDLEINNFDVVTIGSGTFFGRFCSLRDHATPHSSRSIVIGRDCAIGPAVEFAVWDNHHLCLKGDTSVNEGTKIFGSVTVEKYCLLSANIFISSGNHHSDHVPPLLIKDQDILFLKSDHVKENNKPVHIEEDCWIGWGAFLKQGVYIGRGAVIGTYSVVLNDVPPYSIQVGAPNREVRSRLLFQPPDELTADRQDLRPYFYRGFRHRLKEITESLKRDIIFAEDHAAVTLCKNSCSRLKIRGKLNPGINALRIRIQLNGQMVGELMIEESDFDHELKISDENRMFTAAPSVLPSPLQAFNLYVIDIIEVIANKAPPSSLITPYGLSFVQQTPRQQ